MLKLDLTKTLDQNASTYFEKAKKARKKIEGLDRAMANFKEKAPEKDVIVKRKRKLAWYEKFRWFVSSDGFLCIGGRDATSNEIIIKKHTQDDDLVFHTDMAGSPFVVIKAEGKEIPQATIEEAAQFTASMSRAWKQGLGTLDVFYVRPDQVSKEAQAGESLGHGAFMIRGKTQYLHPEIKLSVCEHEGKIMVAPPSACSEGLVLEQGTTKPSDVAKQVKRILKTDDDLDAIIRALPPGDIQLRKP